MTLEPEHVDYGTPMSEWIALVAGDLDRDATGVWELVPAGRDGFRLRGDALVDFLHRCIYRLLDAGAVPVYSGKGTDYTWIAQTHYGSTREEIARSVIAEWQAHPDDRDTLFLVWFARPDPAFPNFVKVT